MSTTGGSSGGQHSAAAKKLRVVGGGGSYQKTITPSDSKNIEVPNRKVGDLVGKAGEILKDLQMQSGAKIQITPDLDADPYSVTRPVSLTGTPEQISKAEKLIQDIVDKKMSSGWENFRRNQSMSTCYSQQGYQAPPPTNSAPPSAPLQQPRGGYSEPGSYPGIVAPQYNMNQPKTYAGYPQQPTSGGCATTWVQPSASSNQQPVHGSGYGQQQPPPGPPAGYYYGQGSGYDQQMPPPDGSQQPSPKPSYPSQPGYGVTLPPQIVTPQSRCAPPPPAGYGPPPPPPAGYGPPSAQQGYGGPSYGAPPPAQPNK